MGYEEDKVNEEEDIRNLESGISYMAAEQGGLYFYHPDHLGTATFLTDINGLPYEFFLNLPFGETMAEQHSQTEDYLNRWKFTGHELDKETGLYYTGARYYDPKVSFWLSVDPLAEKYPNWNPYAYTFQNPINYIDPTGMEGEHIDPSELMKSKDHAEAFVFFAKTKEGKGFLDKYASKGQELTYNGETYYQAGEAGEYDKKGVDLNFNLSNEKIASSTSSKDLLTKRYGKSKLDVNINIATEGFGSDNKKFDLLKAIVHESFLHADSKADDFLDNGIIQDYSNLPKEFAKYKTHADHYFISQQAYKGIEKQFTEKGFNILKQANTAWGLKFSDVQIKSQMWSFRGSLIEVNSNSGKLQYKP